MRKSRAHFFPAAAIGILGTTLLKTQILGRRRPVNLKNKVAVIGGGSRGLGFLVARELARHGCKLVIAARNGAELNKACDRLRREGAEVIPVVTDLTSKSEAESLVLAACDYYGGIDILVNNAGQIQVAPLEDVTAEHFKAAMDLMFWGVLHSTLAAIPHLKARGGGAIVNITSFGGMVAVPHLLPYVSAKFAAVGLSQGLHAELKRHNIIVTTVAPGTMRTGSYNQAHFGGQVRKEYQWFSMGASLPGFSVDAERAARQIVKAIKRRAPFLAIGLPARLGIRFAGLFPGLTAEILAGVNSLLPAPATTKSHILGRSMTQKAESTGWFTRALTTLGTRSEQRFQELKH